MSRRDGSGDPTGKGKGPARVSDDAASKSSLPGAISVYGDAPLKKKPLTSPLKGNPVAGSPRVPLEKTIQRGRKGSLRSRAIANDVVQSTVLASHLDRASVEQEVDPDAAQVVKEVIDLATGKTVSRTGGASSDKVAAVLPHVPGPSSESPSSTRPSSATNPVTEKLPFLVEERARSADSLLSKTDGSNVTVTNIETGEVATGSNPNLFRKGDRLAQIPSTRSGANTPLVRSPLSSAHGSVTLLPGKGANFQKQDGDEVFEDEGDGSHVASPKAVRRVSDSRRGAANVLGDGSPPSTRVGSGQKLSSSRAYSSEPANLGLDASALFGGGALSSPFTSTPKPQGAGQNDDPFSSFPPAQPSFDATLLLETPKKGEVQSPLASRSPSMPRRGSGGTLNASVVPAIQARGAGVESQNGESAEMRRLKEIAETKIEGTEELDAGCRWAVHLNSYGLMELSELGEEFKRNFSAVENGMEEVPEHISRINVTIGLWQVNMGLSRQVAQLGRDLQQANERSGELEIDNNLLRGELVDFQQGGSETDSLGSFGGSQKGSRPESPQVAALRAAAKDQEERASSAESRLDSARKALESSFVDQEGLAKENEGLEAQVSALRKALDKLNKEFAEKVQQVRDEVTAIADERVRAAQVAQREAERVAAEAAQTVADNAQTIRDQEASLGRVAADNQVLSGELAEAQLNLQRLQQAHNEQGLQHVAAISAVEEEKKELFVRRSQLEREHAERLEQLQEEIRQAKRRSYTDTSAAAGEETIADVLAQGEGDALATAQARIAELEREILTLKNALEGKGNVTPHIVGQYRVGESRELEARIAELEEERRKAVTAVAKMQTAEAKAAEVEARITALTTAHDTALNELRGRLQATEIVKDNLLREQQQYQDALRALVGQVSAFEAVAKLEGVVPDNHAEALPARLEALRVRVAGLQEKFVENDHKKDRLVTEKEQSAAQLLVVQRENAGLVDANAGLAVRVEALVAENQALQARFDAALVNIETKERQFAQTEEEIRGQQAVVDEANRQADALRREIAAKTTENQDLQARLDAQTTAHQLAIVTATGDSVAAREAQQKAIADNVAALAELRRRLAEETAAKDKAEGDLADLRAQHEREKHAWENEKIALKAKITTLEARLAEAERNSAAEAARNMALALEVANAAQQQAALQEKYDHLAAQLVGQTDEIAKLQRRIAAAEAAAVAANDRAAASDEQAAVSDKAAQAAQELINGLEQQALQHAAIIQQFNAAKAQWKTAIDGAAQGVGVNNIVPPANPAQLQAQPLPQDQSLADALAEALRQLKDLAAEMGRREPVVALVPSAAQSTSAVSTAPDPEEVGGTVKKKGFLGKALQGLKNRFSKKQPKGYQHLSSRASSSSSLELSESEDALPEEGAAAPDQPSDFADLTARITDLEQQLQAARNAPRGAGGDIEIAALDQGLQALLDAMGQKLAASQKALEDALAALQAEKDRAAQLGADLATRSPVVAAPPVAAVPPVVDVPVQAVPGAGDAELQRLKDDLLAAQQAAAATQQELTRLQNAVRDANAARDAANAAKDQAGAERDVATREAEALRAAAASQAPAETTIINGEDFEARLVKLRHSLDNSLHASDDRIQYVGYDANVDADGNVVDDVNAGNAVYVVDNINGASYDVGVFSQGNDLKLVVYNREQNKWNYIEEENQLAVLNRLEQKALEISREIAGEVAGLRGDNARLRAMLREKEEAMARMQAQMGAQASDLAVAQSEVDRLRAAQGQGMGAPLSSARRVGPVAPSSFVPTGAASTTARKPTAAAPVHISKLTETQKVSVGDALDKATQIIHGINQGDSNFAAYRKSTARAFSEGMRKFMDGGYALGEEFITRPSVGNFSINTANPFTLFMAYSDKSDPKNLAGTIDMRMLEDIKQKIPQMDGVIKRLESLIAQNQAALESGALVKSSDPVDKEVIRAMTEIISGEGGIIEAVTHYNSLIPGDAEKAAFAAFGMALGGMESVFSERDSKRVEKRAYLTTKYLDHVQGGAQSAVANEISSIFNTANNNISSNDEIGDLNDVIAYALEESKKKPVERVGGRPGASTRPGGRNGAFLSPLSRPSSQEGLNNSSPF